MNPTTLEIGIAILMVAMSIAMVVWFRGYLSAASAGRMTDMMTRVGLDPQRATGGDPRLKAIMKNVRYRCRKCQKEDVCERWLAGKVKGSNGFCPNARTFRVLAGVTE